MLRRKPAVNGVDWPRFEQQTQKYVTMTSNPQIRGFLIKPDRLELFADWYDVMQRRSADRRSDRPSLARLLGFRTPSNGGSNANEIFGSGRRDNRSVRRRTTRSQQQAGNVANTNNNVVSVGTGVAVGQEATPRRNLAALVAALAAAQGRLIGAVPPNIPGLASSNLASRRIARQQPLGSLL
jgi:hypothetical protein